MTRLLQLTNTSFALAAMLLASSCAIKSSDSLLAPSPEPSPEMVVAPTTANGSAARNITNFVKLPGQWEDIGIGGAGSDEKIYALATGFSDTGNVYVFNNNLSNPYWTKVPSNGVPGGLNGVCITVDKGGNPWVVNGGGYIYRLDAGTGTWTLLPGQANDIGAGDGGGVYGNVYIIGYGSGDREMYTYDEATNNWYTSHTGAGFRIDADNEGKAWMVTTNGEVYRGGYSGWTRQPGQMKDIGASCIVSGFNLGATYSIGYGRGNKSIYQYVNGSWAATPNGSAILVDVDQNGRPWIINSNKELYYSY